jgi:cobalt-zinc-cadmium efflux system outer membrane protein
MRLARNEARLALATLIAPGDSIAIVAADMRLVDSFEFLPINGPLPLDSLVALAFQHRSDLRAAEYEVAARAADTKLASRLAFSTPTIWLGLKNERAAFDPVVRKGFVLDIALPLPLWDRRGGATDAARAETMRADAERETLRRYVARDVEQAWQMLATTTEQLDTLRPLLGADAQLALHAAATAYAEGEIALVEWLDAVRAYHEAQSSFATLQSDNVIRFMTLERAVGVALSGGTGQ